MMGTGKAAVAALAAIAIASGAQWAYHTFMPRSWWYTYTKIEPVPPLRAGQPITFRSYVIRKRPTSVSWNDILFCDIGDGQGFRFWSSQNTANSYSEKIMDGTTGVPWNYGAAVPMNPATCYLRSTSTLHLSFGIEKQQTIESERFKVQ